MGGEEPQGQILPSRYGVQAQALRPRDPSNVIIRPWGSYSDDNCEWYVNNMELLWKMID